MISLEKIMTKDVVTVSRSTELYDAIRMMVDGNITGLPVVDDENTLEGIVTEKDVMRFLLNTHTTQGTVEDCMIADVTSFNVGDSLEDVICALVEKGFRRVPIVSEGKLEGIVSRRDVIAYIFSCELKDRGKLVGMVAGKVFD